MTQADLEWKTVVKQGLKKPPPSSGAQVMVTIVTQDNDSDKKMPAVSTLAKQDSTQHNTAFVPNTSQSGTNTSNQKDDGAGNDGVGQPWIPG